MAKQFIKDNVIPILTMVIVSVGLVTTAVNTGRASGKLEQKVSHLTSESGEMYDKLDVIESEQVDMKTKQAFLEGVVSTQLTSISAEVTKIGKQVDDLIRAD